MRAPGVVLGQARPLLAPLSIYRENAEALALAANQANATKLANQLEAGPPDRAFINFKSFTNPLWVVPYRQPTVKVWFVKEEGAEETVREKEPLWEKLQEGFDAVPLPLLSLLPKGLIQSSGSDGSAVIWQPSTDKLWEIHRLGKFASGPHQGAWKCGGGHFQNEVSKWNGICAPETGELSASGLSAIAGAIALDELAAVLRGAATDFGHALRVACAETKNEHVAPAVSNDTREGTGPNAVPEGTWVRFPPGSTAAEHGITRPLAVALYNTIRRYGLVVTDSGGVAAMYLCGVWTIFSPYCDSTPNPLNGATFEGVEAYINEGVGEAARDGWIDKTLAAFEGQLNGEHGVLAEMPWGLLELLEPRSS